MATAMEVDDDGSTEESSGLVCIEYPGVVQNPEKAIKTLGGLKNIGQVVSESNRRLELRFRPDDVYCKPTCGERHTCSSFVVRVKRKRLKAHLRGKSEKPEYINSTENLGMITSCYRFNNLCDFQYLPMEKTNTGEHKSIYQEVFFNKLVPSSWIERDTPPPLFLPPAVFSRMDLPQEYQFRREASAEKSGGSMPQNIIGRTRQRRSHHAIFVTYDVDKVPDGPRDIAINHMKIKFIDKQRFSMVEKMFTDQRPIWSKNALHAITRIAPDRLKFMLPALSYYFTTGPWRNQWIRFGYDPRSDPSAGKYQTLDYRIRLQGGARHKVAAKRSYANYLLPYKATNWSKPKTSLITKSSFPGASTSFAATTDDPPETEEEADARNDVYIFRKGRIPPYRQMFYQYCDIQLEDAQKLLECSGTSECSEKSGWYEPGTEEKLRNIISDIINAHISEQRLKELDETEGGEEFEEGEANDESGQNSSDQDSDIE